jgi:succinyl-CoA synthetase beta subunit
VNLKARETVGMNIHEYQAKAILRDFGAPVAVGVPVQG